VERFDAPIVEARGGGACVMVPAAVVEALGGGGRIPVQVTFDGIPYAGSIVSMGGGDKVLGVLKDIRTRLGKGPGDTLTITIERDEQERSVVVPADLAAALAEAGRTDTFAAVSYSKQRAAVQSIEAAKAAETRARRVAKVVDGL
jgi:hypothetical protein